MTTNTLLTTSLILNEAQRILHNNLVFAKGVNREYSSQFNKTGAKIGATVNVRNPNQYYVRTGATLTAQNTVESTVPVTVNRQWGVDISFTSSELALSLDDFSKRILAPALAKVASRIDLEGLQLSNNIYNCVGTPGITPGTSGGSATGLAQYNAPICFLNAGMMLDNSACPRDENRRVVMNPAAHAQSVSGLSGLFNSQDLLGEQYRKGVLGSALGFEFAMDQNINTLTSPALTNGTTSAVLVNNTNTIAITGGGVSLTVPAGAVFTVAGVYSVNPENQQSTGLLQQFVNTSAVALDAVGGAGTLTVSPTPILSGATVANGTVTTATGDFSATNGAAVTWVTNVSGSGVTSPQNMAYHSDAFTLATVDLPVPEGVDFAGRIEHDGISMRIVRAYDINNDAYPCRIDVLGGWAVLRPQLACRILG